MAGNIRFRAARFLAAWRHCNRGHRVVFSSLLQPAIAAEIKRQRKQVILIWLDGGISQLKA